MTLTTYLKSDKEPATLCRECYSISPGHRYACTNPRCGGYYPGPKHLTHGYRDRQALWVAP